MTRRALATLALVVTLVLAACGTGTPDDAGPAPDGAGPGRPEGDLLVLAAASLHTVVEEITARFEAEHPGTTVSLSFAGSADLVAQLAAGVPADVLLTADESTMAAAVSAGTVAGPPEVFAHNTLSLVVPRGNPAGVTGLDESLDDAHLVVCAPQVPCGAAATALAELLGRSLSPVSEESSVVDVLGKVTSGQADAGLVYATDAAAAAGAVEVVAVDRTDEVVNRYPAAVTTGARDAALARAWVDHLRAPESRRLLTAAGFGTP